MKFWLDTYYSSYLFNFLYNIIVLKFNFMHKIYHFEKNQIDDGVGEKQGRYGTHS